MGRRIGMVQSNVEGVVLVVDNNDQRGGGIAAIFLRLSIASPFVVNMADRISNPELKKVRFGRRPSGPQTRIAS